MTRLGPGLSRLVPRIARVRGRPADPGAEVLDRGGERGGVGGTGADLHNVAAADRAGQAQLLGHEAAPGSLVVHGLIREGERIGREDVAGVEQPPAAADHEPRRTARLGPGPPACEQRTDIQVAGHGGLAQLGPSRLQRG